jgi:hypothetical protein
MAPTKKPVPPPAAANSSGLTVTGGVYSNNNWISASGEAHGNGSFSASGGSFNGSGEIHNSFSTSGGNYSLVSIASKSRKGVGGKPRDPETARRDAKIVQEFLDLRAQNPDRKKVKDKTIISDVGRDHGVGASYVRRKLAEYRKKLGTDPNHPHTPTSWDEFHATVKPGQYFLNPADGKLYKRKTDLYNP